MCTNPKYISVQPSFYDRLNGICTPYKIPIPCGKCFECLSARQNSFMIRTYREAMKYGNMWHLTLTYDEAHLPMAQSVRWVDVDTGELAKSSSCVEAVEKSWQTVSELHFPRYHKRYGYRLKKDGVRIVYEKLAPSPLREEVLSQSEDVKRSYPRMASCQFLPSDSKGLAYQYFETPSYDPKDVVSLIKYCKTEFSRVGKPVENLRYLICPEYGERCTRRPHYHCVLINCPEDFARRLFNVWRFGHVVSHKNGKVYKHFGYGLKCTLQRVMLKCKKYKGNGFRNLAAYVSKYACKGFMDNPAALQGFTRPMRIHSSIGFGSFISDFEKRYHLAQDLFDYDPCDISNLPKKTLSDIVETIVRRLNFKLADCNDKDGKPLPFRLPESIVRRIFGFRLCKSRQDLPRYFRLHLPIGQTFARSGSSFYDSIYYEVQNYIRSKIIQDNQREFVEFVANFPSKSLSAAVAAFEKRRDAVLRSREETHKFYLLNKLKHATI